jgi:hypothetical protein
MSGTTARFLNIGGDGATFRTCHDATPSTTFKICARYSNALIWNVHIRAFINDGRHKVSEGRKALRNGATNPSIGRQCARRARGAYILGVCKIIRKLRPRRKAWSWPRWSGSGQTKSGIKGSTASVLNTRCDGAAFRTFHDATPSTTFKIGVRDTDALIWNAQSGVLALHERGERVPCWKALRNGATNPSIGRQCARRARGACILGGSSSAPETSGEEESQTS